MNLNNKYNDFAYFALKTLEDIEEKLLAQDEECCLDIVLYSPDILEINSKLGVHVINISNANCQLWLSSPISGPAHFSYLNEAWVSKKNNQQLYSILEKELKTLIPNLSMSVV